MPSIIPKVPACVFFHDQRQAHTLSSQLELFHCPNTTFHLPRSTKKISFITPNSLNVRHCVYQPPPAPLEPTFPLHLHHRLSHKSAFGPRRKSRSFAFRILGDPLPFKDSHILLWDPFPAEACKYVLTSCNRSLYMMLAKTFLR